MAELIKAFLANSISGGNLANDGSNIVIRFEGPDEPFNVAFPPAELMRLVSLCAKLSGEKTPVPGGGKFAASVIPVQWWTVGRTDDGRVSVSFEPEGGGILSFGLSPAGALQFLEALSVHLGATTIQKPEGPAN